MDEEEEDDDLDLYDELQGQHDVQREKGCDTIFSSRGGGVSLGRRQGYDYPPTWLQASSHMRNHPPALQMDTLSLHILDQGYGANALLTVRQMDGENQKRLTLEQQSRAGVLGRIISGVWAKVAEVRNYLYLCPFSLCYILLQRILIYYVIYALSTDSTGNNARSRYRSGRRDHRLPRLSSDLPAHAGA